MFKNLNHIKSTALGLVFISTGLYLLIKAITFNYYIIGGLEIAGILLLFAPDDFINWIEKQIIGKEINLKDIMKDK